jgi:hypothetical protein
MQILIQEWSPQTETPRESAATDAGSVACIGTNKQIEIRTDIDKKEQR